MSYMRTTSALVFECAIANSARIFKILTVSTCVTSFFIAPAHANPTYDIVWLDDLWVTAVSRDLAGVANATVGIVGDSVIGPTSSVPSLTASTEAGPLFGKVNQKATLSRRFTIVRNGDKDIVPEITMSASLGAYMDLTESGELRLIPSAKVLRRPDGGIGDDIATKIVYEPGETYSSNVGAPPIVVDELISESDRLALNTTHKLSASLHVQANSNSILPGPAIASATLDLRQALSVEGGKSADHRVLWLTDWNTKAIGVDNVDDSFLGSIADIGGLIIEHNTGVPSWISSKILEVLFFGGSVKERFDFEDGLMFVSATGQASFFNNGDASLTLEADREFMIVSAKSDFVSLSFDGLLEGALNTDAITRSDLKLAQVKIDGANIEWTKNAVAKNGNDVTIFEPFGLEATVLTNKIFTYQATLDLSSEADLLALGSTSAEFLSSLGGELSVAAADAFFTAEKPLATDPNPNGGNFLNSEIGAGHQKIADEFTSDLAGFVTMVQWYGAFAPLDLSTTLFEIQFYKDVGGAPAMDPFFSHVFDLGVGAPTGVTLSSIDVLMYEADFSGLQAYLPQGQSWISIRAADPSSQFFWSISDPALGDPIYHRFNDESAWSVPVGDGRTEAAFAVFVQAPEPGLLALAGSGLAFLALLAVRRQTGVSQRIAPSAAP